MVFGLPAEWLISKIPFLHLISPALLIKQLKRLAHFKLKFRKQLSNYLRYTETRDSRNLSDISRRIIVGEEMIAPVIAGKIQKEEGILRLDGKYVHFKDNTKEKIDIIINATGYKYTFPFLINTGGHLEGDKYNFDPHCLDLFIFPKKIKELFFVGLINPLGAHWPVYEQQARLLARTIISSSEVEKIMFPRKRHDKSSFSICNNDKYQIELGNSTVINPYRYLYDVKKLIQSL